MAPTRKTGGRTTPKGTKPAEEPRVTPANEWVSGARHPVPLKLPSGNTCLAINKGMQAFLAEGRIPNSLLPLVHEALNKAEGKEFKPEDVAKLGDNPEMMSDILKLVDAVTLSCVISPEIHPTPMAMKKDHQGNDVWYVVMLGIVGVDEEGNEVKRNPDLLYVDDLDMDDKMFIFQWSVGGTKDLEKFRKEHSAFMAGVQGSEGVGSKTE